MAPNAVRGGEERDRAVVQHRASTRGDSHRDLPTPPFALDVQRASIPGGPNVVELSGGFIG